jgi:hypothetical protein
MRAFIRTTTPPGGGVGGPVGAGVAAGAAVDGAGT